MNVEINDFIKLDWLSFTVPNTVKSKDRLKNFFDNMTVVNLGYGGLGYTNSAVLGDGGRLYWNDERPEMGLHVRLSAATLVDVETAPIGMLMRIKDWGGQVTRMDLAFDDTSGWLDMDEMHMKILSGEVVTRWRRVTRIDGRKIGKDEKMGDTINVGSRTSEAFLRIYDKLLEQRGEGSEVLDMDFWVRVELELKGDKAAAFADILCDTMVAGTAEPGELCAELLYGLLDFKDEPEDGDTNKSRWPTSHWWRGFVGAMSKLRLAQPEASKTLDDSKRWVWRSVSTTLAMIVLAENDQDGETGYEFIMGCIQDGAGRMSKEQQMRLDLYNEERISDRNSRVAGGW